MRCGSRWARGTAALTGRKRQSLRGQASEEACPGLAANGGASGSLSFLSKMGGRTGLGPLSLQKCPQALSLPSPPLPHPSLRLQAPVDTLRGCPSPRRGAEKGPHEGRDPLQPRPIPILHALHTPRGELTSPRTEGPTRPRSARSQEGGHASASSWPPARPWSRLSSASRQVGQPARHWLRGAASDSCSDTCEQHFPAHAIHYSQRGCARHSQPGRGRGEPRIKEGHTPTGGSGPGPGNDLAKATARAAAGGVASAHPGTHWECGAWWGGSPCRVGLPPSSSVPRRPCAGPRPLQVAWK